LKWNFNLILIGLQVFFSIKNFENIRKKNLRFFFFEQQKRKERKRIFVKRLFSLILVQLSFVFMKFFLKNKMKNKKKHSQKERKNN
jgi:hypothetical protein